MKGQTKRHANAHLVALERTEGGRWRRVTQAPAQAVSTAPARRRSADRHHKARRRAANRRARASRKANRRG